MTIPRNPAVPTRRSCLAMLLAGMVLVLSGCNDADEDGPSGSASERKRIIILTNGPDPFWDTCEAGAKRAEEELGLAGLGYEVDFQRGDFTDEAQISKLKQYGLDDDIVAVGISVYEPRSLGVAEEMRKLQEAGIHVITIDGDVNEEFRDARYAYLGTNNLIAGQELGKAAAVLNPEANFAFFVGSTSNANAVARMDGFVEGIGDQATEVERLDDGGDSNKARQNVESTLSRHEEVDMLVGIWAYNTPQIINVITAEEGLRERMNVLCFDADELSIAGIADGNVDVMIVQNPYQMGYEGVRMMLAMVQNDKEVMNEMLPDYAQEGEHDIFRTELRVVVPDESPIERGIFEEETQFFTLPEFQEWLSERGLKSS